MGKRASAAAAAVLVLPWGVGAQIVKISSGSLTTFQPSVSVPVQGIRPMVQQRGVGVDGAGRARGSYGWSLAGNPFPQPTAAVARVGVVDAGLGSYARPEVDLALPAAGRGGVVIGRSFNGRQVASGGGHQDSAGYMGFNWQYGAQPEIVVYDNVDDTKDQVYLVYGADAYAEFKRASGDYFGGVNGGAGAFEYRANNGGSSGEPDTYVYTDQAGNRAWFFGFDGDAGAAAGQFWKFVDAAGNTVYAGDATTASTAISAGFTGGKVGTLFDGAGRRYCHTYTSVGGSPRLTQVLVETDAGGGWGSCGTETEVGRVEYEYYTSDATDVGLTGDLKLVTVTTPQSDSGVTVKSRTYYRYYTRAWSNSDGRRGEAHQVRLVLGPEGCRKYDYDADAALEYGGGTDPEFLAATDADLKPYSEAYLEYGSGDYRVSKAFFGGECGCSGGANGTYEFTYGTNGSYSDTTGYDTVWATRTVIKRPDAIYETRYFDETGQPLSTVVTDGDPGVSYTDLWATEVVRDADGFVTAVHTPANNSTYTHSTGAFTRHSSAGLVHVYARISSGDLKGFTEGVQYKEGNSGTAYFTSWTEYTTRTLSLTGADVVRPMVAKQRAYHTATSAYSTANTYDETQTSYAWWSGTNTALLYLAPKQVTTTLPAVTTGQNGSNSSNTREVYLRQDGTAAFVRAEDGIFTYTLYSGGQLATRVEDVKTNGSFAGGDDPNTDWGITETGSGSDRTTQFGYDAQGRPDTVTGPDGRVSKSYYSRLKDGRRVVIGWPRRTTGGSTTYFGPASYGVSNHAGKSEFQGTIAIGPSGLTDALSGWIDETDGDPVTALDKGTLARMATSLYTSSGHQLTESRSYFSLPGSGAGTEGTHYDAVRYGYDNSGRRWRVKDATGTITRTTYDDLGRVSQAYLGTNDRNFSGGESTGTDNMVKTSENTYDSGGDGGNSLLTTRTLFVEDSATDQRETSYLYDYRGRAVVTLPPQAPYTLTLLDNLGRPTAVGLYSSSSGLDAGDDPTGLATNRAALTRSYYDALGRVYRSTRHNIDAGDGSDDDSVETLTWRDAAGRVIKVVGEELSKTVYDRLGRATHRFALIKTNDSGYGDADDVSGDRVLEEHQTVYAGTDSDNVVMTVAIARHHDDASGTGALDANADGGTPALLKLTAADVTGRAQITAVWHDDLDRVVDTVRYGTNAIVGDGSTATGTFDRAGLSVPSRSATALRTTTAYNDDGTVLAVTDPRALVMRYEYDALGRTVTEIRNYVNGAPSSETGDDDVHTRSVYAQGC